MSLLSDYAENKVLDLVLRNTTWSRTNTYASLHTADPGETGASEVAAGWYIRKAIVFNAADTGTPANGATSNGQVNFDAVSGSSVTITHIGLWDAATSGNFLWRAALSASKLLVDGSVGFIPNTGINVTAGGGFTNFLIPKIIDHVLATAAYTPAATVYLALYAANPTAADSATEFSAGSYARQSIAFVAAASGATDNSADVTFPTATADVGIASHFVIKTAVSAGNGLIFGALTSTYDIKNGDVYKVLTGALDITCA